MWIVGVVFFSYMNDTSFRIWSHGEVRDNVT